MSTIFTRIDPDLDLWSPDHPQLDLAMMLNHKRGDQLAEVVAKWLAVTVTRPVYQLDGREGAMRKYWAALNVHPVAWAAYPLKPEQSTDPVIVIGLTVRFRDDNAEQVGTRHIVEHVLPSLLRTGTNPAGELARIARGLHDRMIDEILGQRPTLYPKRAQVRNVEVRGTLADVYDILVTNREGGV